MHGMNEFPGFPWEVEWSITWACNTHCFFCSTGRYDRSLYAADVGLVAERIIAAKPLTVTLSGGEPLVHPKIGGVIDAFLNKKLPLNLTTNGLALSRLSPIQFSGMNWIRISLHAESDDVAKRIMGQTYNVRKVISNIEALGRHNVNFSIFALLTKANSSQCEITKLVKLVKNLGAARLEIGIIKLLGWANKEMLLPKKELERSLEFLIEAASAYGVEVSIPEIDQDLHLCSARARNAAIFPDGSVRSCSFDHDEQWGNILSDSLEEIWRRRSKLDNYCDRCAPGGYQQDFSRGDIPITSIE